MPTNVEAIMTKQVWDAMNRILYGTDPNLQYPGIEKFSRDAALVATALQRIVVDE